MTGYEEFQLIMADLKYKAEHMKNPNAPLSEFEKLFNTFIKK